MESTKGYLKIRTPEQVGFQYVLAGMGRRTAAYLWDMVFRAVLVLFLFVAAMLLVRWLPALDPTGFLAGLSQTWILALVVAAYGVVDLGYFIFFEGLWNGQTPGKRLQGIRVIRVNGQPIGWLESTIRNILRAVDLLAGLYPLGLVFMFLSARSQRIGDYAAGTVVVVERKHGIPEVRPEARGQGEGIPDLETVISDMKSDEYQLVQSFLLRREGMDTRHRSQLARTLAHRLMKRWGMAPSPTRPYEAFLEEVARVYERSRRAL